jgi:hypothetical protein
MHLSQRKDLDLKLKLGVENADGRDHAARGFAAPSLANLRSRKRQTHALRVTLSFDAAANRSNDWSEIHEGRL